MSIIIKQIMLSLDDWGVNKGKLTGSISLVNEYGEIKLTIGADKTAEIVVILADALVATARDTAALMTANIIEQVRPAALPHVTTEAAHGAGASSTEVAC